MRTGRLGDRLDQDAGSIDHTEHGASAQRRAGGFDGVVGSGVVAIAALVSAKPDFIRRSNATYLGIIMGFGVDDQRGRAARQVARRAAQQ